MKIHLFPAPGIVFTISLEGVNGVFDLQLWNPNYAEYKNHHQWLLNVWGGANA
jgi:hypothetical protein